MDVEYVLESGNVTNIVRSLDPYINSLLLICLELPTNNSFFSPNDTELNINRTLSFFSELCSQNLLTKNEIIIITCYAFIVVISIFGNLLVCNVVARMASFHKTTYVLIANLAFSDLLLTVLNIPFNVTRNILKDWPFGSFMCSFMPLVQVMSVYVSTFTMMLIALDRYRVICSPFKPKLGPLRIKLSIICVWIMAILLSLPYTIWNKVENVFSYRPLTRCRMSLPHQYTRWIGLITAITQYFVPLSMTGIIYFFIARRVWRRDVLGAVTPDQLITQSKAKRKTIKMLLLVVILFAICWLPLNIYNLLKEFTTLDINHGRTYFICHMIAMSSACYNPFIYCWLNKKFRSGAVTCFSCIHKAGRKLNTSFRSTRVFRMIDFQSQSDNPRTDSLYQSKDAVDCCKTGQPHRHSRSFDRESCNKIKKECVPMKTINAIGSSSKLAADIFGSGYYSMTDKDYSAESP